MCLQVITVLKKELMRTQSNELERAGEYRQVLVQCVHKCAVKHPDVAAGVVHLLMEFLGDSQSVGGTFSPCDHHPPPVPCLQLALWLFYQATPCIVHRSQFWIFFLLGSVP